MRHVGLMDLYHAARAVEGMPYERQIQALHELLRHAHIADKYVKRLGRLHPLWGDGSLRAAALRDVGTSGISTITEDFLISLANVAALLAEKHRCRQDQ